MENYTATPEEIEVAREIFGGDVDRVRFRAAEHLGYETISGHDREGRRIGDPLESRYRSFDFGRLEALASQRGMIDDFRLTGIDSPMPDAEEEELAKALRAVRRAAEGDSNDDEIDAYRDALETALARWPGLSL